MKSEELRGLFCLKISMELKAYERKMLKRGSEDIYQSAYQIDHMVSIYEILMEMSQEMADETLQMMLVIPSLLAFLYRRWLKKNDSAMEELQECLKKNMEEISSGFLGTILKEKEFAA